MGSAENPQNGEEDDLRGETVEHTGDGVVERMVELIEWFEEGGFIFEKITG